MPLPNAKQNSVLIMLLLTALLSACATPSPISVTACPQLPPIPAVSQPIPPSTYSESVRLKLEDWQRRLTATPATLER